MGCVQAHLPAGASLSRGFIEAGGDSLSAVRLVAQLCEQFGVTIKVGAVLGSDSAEDIVREVIVASRPDGRPTPSRAADTVPAAQRQMLLEETMGSGAPAHMVGIEFDVRGPLCPGRYAEAMQDLVGRHAALRTRFWFDGSDFRREFAAGIAPEIASVDIGDDADLRQLRRTELWRKPDFGAPLVPRLTIARVGPDHHRLLVAAHHLVCDGWSLNILGEELMELYAARAEARAPRLGARPAQPEDLAGAEHMDEDARGLEYWVERLRGGPQIVTVPPDRPRPDMQGFALQRAALSLQREDLSAITALARERKATSYSVLLAAWLTLLGRLTGNGDVRTAVPMSNRHTPAQTRAIGMFVNVVVIRTVLRPGERFAAVVDDVHRQLLAAQDHQHVPFVGVVERLAPERTLAWQPLVQTMFVMQPAGRRRFSLPGGAEAVMALDLGVPEQTRCDLVISVQDDEGGFRAWADYDAALYERQTIGELMSVFAAWLREVQADSQATPPGALTATGNRPRGPDGTD